MGSSCQLFIHSVKRSHHSRGYGWENTLLLQLVSSGVRSLSSRVLCRPLAASSSKWEGRGRTAGPPSPPGPCRSLRYTKAEAEEEEEEETW